MKDILLTIAAVLVLIWLIGVILHILGGLIYIALVVAAVIFVYDVLVVRRRKPRK
jgi:4-hydroxybenzoate polyprenyltransferase